MKVAPGGNVVDVHVPRGADRKTPSSPVAVQEGVRPLPAPMSDETTATWMFGRPPGRFSSTFMNVGIFLSRFVCDSSIDDELSIMKSRSRFPFEMTARASVCKGSAPFGAQAPSATADATTPTAARLSCRMRAKIRSPARRACDYEVTAVPVIRGDHSVINFSVVSLSKMLYQPCSSWGGSPMNGSPGFQY